MKCTNCGANYDSMMMNCPYCNTVNQKNKIFKKRKQAAAGRYNAMAQQMGQQAQKRSTNSVLNRVLVIEALTVVGIVVMSMVLSVIDVNSYSSSITKGMTKKEMVSEVKRLYKEEEFDKMALIYTEGRLYDVDELDLEASLAYVYNDYQEFIELRALYMKGLKESDISDTTINSLLYAMNQVLKVENNEYADEYDKQNEKYFNVLIEDVKAFAKGVLLLTDEEVSSLGMGGMKNDLETQLRKAIKARR